MKKKKKESLWTKSLPIEEGWYWVKYYGKRGQVICPSQVSHLFLSAFRHKGKTSRATFVRTAQGDTFCWDNAIRLGEHSKDEILFGPPIPVPEEE